MQEPDSTISAVGAAPTPDKPAYPSAAAQPTQEGPSGIRFDFNLGARVQLPPRDTGRWRIRLKDLDTGNVLFESENQGALVNSTKRWYVRFRIEIWEIDDPGEAREILCHDYAAAGRNILIQLPVGTLGDTLAWFPYVDSFARQHSGAQVIVAMSGTIRPILKDAYPALQIVTHEEFVEQRLADQIYATYSIGLFFDDASFDWQPTDFRLVGLHRTAAYILGVQPEESPVRLGVPDRGRPIPEPYVCIAVQSSSGAKYWNNPAGWLAVVSSLRARGYRVICIDQKSVHGTALTWHTIPNGAEDLTGDRPLEERVQWLRHAAFFVGLSSGLAWLAWSAGTPVVLISGFTHPTNEFATPYRVMNWHACNSCWNDPQLRFDHRDFFWCPRHKDTPRHFECTRLITADLVLRTIARIPGILPLPAAS